MSNIKPADLKIQIFQCLDGMKAFLANYKSILDPIGQQKQEYLTPYVDILQQVLLDPAADCNKKFFSFFLLTKSTETRNLLLINTLCNRKQLLQKFEKDAEFDKDKPIEERGSTFFSKTPSKLELSMGKNYVRLVIESIQYWNKEYSTDDKKRPENVFRQMFGRLLNVKVKFNDKFLVIGRTVEEIMGVGKTNAQAQAANQKPKLGLGDVLLNQVKENLDTLFNAKEAILDMISLDYEDSNNTEIVKAILTTEVEAAGNNLKKIAPQIYDINNPELEALSPHCFDEIDGIESILRQLKQFENSRIKYQTFKENLLIWINLNKNNSEEITPGGSDELAAKSVQNNEELKEDSPSPIKKDESPIKNKQEELSSKNRNQVELPNKTQKQEQSIHNTQREEPLSSRSQNQEQASQNSYREEQLSSRSQYQQQQAQSRPQNHGLPPRKSLTQDQSQEKLLNKSQKLEDPPQKKLESQAQLLPMKDEIHAKSSGLKNVVGINKKPEEAKELKVDQKAGILNNKKELNNVPIENGTKKEDKNPQNSNQIHLDDEIKPIKQLEKVMTVNTASPGIKEIIQTDPRKEENKASFQKDSSYPLPKEKTDLELPMQASNSTSIRNERDIGNKINIIDSFGEDKQILMSANSSIRGTPKRSNMSEDLGKIESVLYKLSKSKLASVEMSSIDKSIKSTFKTLGKAPPEYEGLTELQVREKLETNAEELKIQTETLKSQINSLQLKLDDAVKNAPKNDDEIKGYQQMIQTHKNEIISLKESNEQLINDFNATKTELARSEVSKLELEKNAENAKAELAKYIELSKIELSKSINLSTPTPVANVEQNPKYQAIVNENSELKNKLDELALELSQTKAVMANINKIESSDLKSKLKELQGQNQTLSKTLQELNLKNLTLSNKVCELEEMQNSTINAIKIEDLNQKSNRAVLQKTETVHNPNAKNEISYYETAGESPFRKFLFEPSLAFGNSPGTGSFGVSLGSIGGSLEMYNGQGLFGSIGNPGISSIGTAIGENRYEYVDDKMNPKKLNTFSPNMQKIPKAVTYEDIVGKEDDLQSISNKKFEEFSLGNLVSSYKENTLKEVKGTLVDPDNSVLHNMLNGMSFVDGINKLAYFKMSCLKTKSPIYENHLVQIGASTTVVRDQSTHRNHLKITLYYGNKTSNNITNFTTQINACDLFQTFCKPEKLDGGIAPQKQLKQQIIVNFLKFPFPCLRLDCGVATSKDLSTFNIYLPTTINKLMEFKSIDPKDFKKKWKQENNLNILKTTEFRLDGAIAKNVHDLKNYFNHLVDLRPTNEYDFIHGKKSIKLVGCFELDQQGVEYFLKFIVLTNKNVVFQLACPYEYTELGAFVLQTLSFLFRA